MLSIHVEVWIASRLLGTEKNVFSKKELMEKIFLEFQDRRPGISTHITSYCVASTKADPAGFMYLTRVGRGLYKIFEEGDPVHSTKMNAPLHPSIDSIPEKYKNLLSVSTQEPNIIPGDQKDLVFLKSKIKPELNFNDCQILEFIHIGAFYLANDDLELDLDGVSSENGCYLFSIDDEVCYVGVTSNGIRHRMRQYRRPGPRQKTNQHVKSKMLEILPKIGKISIEFLEDKEINELDMSILQHGIKVKSDMKLLERFLINGLKPRWNRS